nr:hypothetical protein [Paracoccus saliphilus]
MSQDAATPEEQRALSKDEQDLADRARQPALGALSDKELSDLIPLLRDRRNRARDISDRQGREARGKADPAGANPAGGNEGTRSKADYLNAALDRAMAERDRRQSGGDDQVSQAELSRRAMEMKDDAQDQNPMMEDGAPLHPDDPDADPGKKGMAQTERNTAPSGALDHAGEGPARERSRMRR